MRKGRVVAAIMMAAVLVMPAVCFGWGAGGHEMVALIAYKRLNSHAKKEVDRLLRVAITPKPKPNATTGQARFIHAAHWPDDVKSAMPQTASEHYADFPFSPDQTPLPDLPEPVNVINALKEKVDLLRTSNNDVEKAKALRFLIHYVGDIHQPLHCSTRVTAAHPQGDRGGNDFIILVGGRSTKLHSFWDGGCNAFPKQGANFAPPPDSQIPPAVTSALQGNPASDPQITSGGAEDFEGWAKESSDLAQSAVYAALTENAAPPSGYVPNGVKLAKKRVAWGGYRLANLLNAIYP